MENVLDWISENWKVLIIVGVVTMLGLYGFVSLRGGNKRWH